MTLSHLSELIETEIQSLDLQSEPRGLYEPIEYIMNLGGKRMRPVLVLIAYSLFKKNPEAISREALSVEVFHNFTLMHDDIMDNAPIRRGEATVHEKWDNTSAILSGDAMMIKAYQLLERLDPAMHFKALKKFNQCALEVCEGQKLDMDLETKTDATVEEYLEMIRLKTAVLLGFSLELGALLAGQDEQVQRKLCDIGVKMGLAFQLMDDHLDTFGDETFGKQIGGDILANKKTFLLLTALESDHKTELLRWVDQPASQEKVDRVTSIYREAGVDQVSRNKILAFGQQADEMLDEIDGAAKAKELLSAYIAKLNQRVS